MAPSPRVRAAIFFCAAPFMIPVTVDAIGHDGKTEGHTFEAVRWTLTKLSALVGVTADHGFR
jgi:hypothetical protein